MRHLIIGDVAGQFGALMRLVNKFPAVDRIILVGDLPDRGPKSREVIEWAKRQDRPVITLKGNHEDMMVDACLGRGGYQRGIWLMNGGLQTLRSYGFAAEEVYAGEDGLVKLEAAYPLIPRGHLEWMDKLPICHIEPGLFVSHAPWAGRLPLGASDDDRRPEMSPLWNRSLPRERPGIFQVFGHQSPWGLRRFDDWGICLDDSRAQKLTGLLWPENEVVQEDYEEKK